MKGRKKFKKKKFVPHTIKHTKYVSTVKLTKLISAITIACPGIVCGRFFKEDRGLTAHLDKSPSCTQALTKIMYCQPTMKTLEATDNTQIQSQMNSSTEYQFNSIDNNMEDTNINIEDQSLERLEDQVNIIKRWTIHQVFQYVILRQCIIKPNF